MKEKGENCYSVTRAEMMEHLQRPEAFLWHGKFGPYYYIDWPALPKWRECHPNRETVLRLIEERVLVESADANSVQRECGLSSFRLAVKE